MHTIEQFEKQTEALMEKYHIQGVMVAMQKEGEIVYDKGFGYRDVENKRAPTLETVFGIASLTKSFTCVGIMQLVEAGKIDLHAPITTYIPQFIIPDKDALAEMTVHHFMTHSSALPPLPSLDYAMERAWNEEGMVDHKESHEDAIPLQTYEQLIAFIDEANVQLLGKVGEPFSYSNDAYGLLGLVIENVSGIPYESYLEEHVFSPCDLVHTHFLISDYKEDAQLTTCYETHDEADGSVTVYRVQDWWDAPPMRATGFLKSTAADMLQYSKLYMHDGLVDGVRILSADSVKAITTRHLQMDPLNDYGYGFSMPHDFFGKQLLEHGGSLQSVSAKFGIIPEEELSVIVLANTSGFASTKVLRSLLNVYAGRELNALPFTLGSYEVAAADIASYLGRYKSGEGMDLTFRLENEQLVFTYKEEEYPVQFIREHVFVAHMDDGIEPCEIIVDDKGVVTGVSIFHRIVPKIENDSRS